MMVIVGGSFLYPHRWSSVQKESSRDLPEKLLLYSFSDDYLQIDHFFFLLFLSECLSHIAPRHNSLYAGIDPKTSVTHRAGLLPL